MPPAVVSFISSIATLLAVSHCFPSSSLCLVHSQVFVYKEIGYKNMLLRIDLIFKKATTAHCSVPMLKRPSDEAAHLIDGAVSS